MRRFASVVICCVPLFAAGCCLGLGSGTSLTGAVTLDGQPLEGATVMYVPVGDTPGKGGGAITNAKGTYEIKVDGKRGLAPGEYKVFISKYLNPDGSPPPKDVPPIESEARETLPAIYSDPMQTKLTAKVTGDGKPIDFSLELPKKE